jgi:hypothetical protein
MPDAGTSVKHVGQSRIGLGSGAGAAVFRVDVFRVVGVLGAALRAGLLEAVLRAGVKCAVRSGVPPSRGRPTACQWR